LSSEIDELNDDELDEFYCTFVNLLCALCLLHFINFMDSIMYAKYVMSPSDAVDMESPLVSIFLQFGFTFAALLQS